MKKSLAIVGLLACAPLWAAEGPSYNHVQLDFVADTELDVSVPGLSGSTDGDGFDLSGVFSVNETWFVKGNYEALSYDGDVDLDLISVGVGGHTNAFTGGVDLFGVISYEDVELDTSVGTGEDDGFGVEVGASMMLGTAIDVSASYQFISYDDTDGNLFRVGGGYAFMPQWSVRVDYLTGDYEDGGFDLDRDDLSVGVRYSF